MQRASHRVEPRDSNLYPCLQTRSGTIVKNRRGANRFAEQHQLSPADDLGDKDRGVRPSLSKSVHGGWTSIRRASTPAFLACNATVIVGCREQRGAARGSPSHPSPTARGMSVSSRTWSQADTWSAAAASRAAIATPAARASVSAATRWAVSVVRWSSASAAPATSCS